MQTALEGHGGQAITPCPSLQADRATAKDASSKLIGNLVVPQSTSGILIQSNDVTLDLNGFSITGGIVCDQDGFSCTPTPTSGDPTGIEAILGVCD